jgi:hypothetical protein
VTVFFGLLADNPPRANFDRFAAQPLAAAARRRNHVAHGMIPKSGIRFSEQDRAQG